MSLKKVMMKPKESWTSVANEKLLMYILKRS